MNSMKTNSLAIVKRRVSLIAQLEKNLPAMWETWIRSLGWEVPLEKGKATYSSILSWRIPWTVARQAPLSMGILLAGILE